MRKGYSLFGSIPELIGEDPEHDMLSRRDEYWMAQALLEGMKGCGLSEPNPGVGCILVNKDGIAVSRGSTEVCGQRHAERVAIEALSPEHNPHELTLYCTLEPCSHTGRQPPCVDLIIGAGIKRCVVGVGDPDLRVNGRGFSTLRAAGVEVETGVLGSEVAAWHLPFLMRHSMGRPLIVGKWAQTLDGQLAFDSGTPRWVSCAESRICAHWLRQRYDAILVGAGTAISDKPTLTVRNSPLPIHRQPVRVLFDPSGRVFQVSDTDWQTLRATLFSLDSPVVVVRKPLQTTLDADRWSELEALGHIHLHIIPPGTDALKYMIASLSEPSVAADLGRPINSVLVEGGPKLLSLLLQRDLVDIAHVFQSSAIGGGQHARLMSPPERLSALSTMDIVNTAQIKTDVLIELANKPVKDILQLADVSAKAVGPELRYLLEPRGDFINV